MAFFVQLAPYLLLEYTYSDTETTFLSSAVKLARVQNDYASGQMQFLNLSSAAETTQNVLNTSAVNVGSTKWAFLNTDAPVPYINVDSKIVYDDMSLVFTSLSVAYDKVKFHIQSGYQLEDIDGLIFQVYAREAQTTNLAILANNVYLKSDSREIFNARPLMMGEKMYDRYVEFLIPSVKEANRDYYSNPTNPISLGYQYSSNNRGWLYESAIYVKVYEIGRTEKKNGNTFFYTDQTYEINVNQEDSYSALVANIKESSAGDYFEYYPTYKGDFVSTFLSDLSSQGGDYVVINDVDVYEQVGEEQILTNSFSQVQLGDFDAPLTFRPILKYVDSALAFSIDYTARVYNRSNGFQIIRRASISSYQPRKYGRNLEKINLSNVVHPFKVYNKLSTSNLTITGNEVPQSFNTVFLPVFYDTKSIVVDTKTILSEGANPISPNFDSAVQFGQGEARIYLSDFEGYFKFLIQQKDAKTGLAQPINLSANIPILAFKDKTGNILRYPALASTSENSLVDGEIVFKLAGDVRSKVLYDDLPKTFYILAGQASGSETLMYTGSVEKIEKIKEEPSRVEGVKAKAEIPPTAPITNPDIASQITAAAAAKPVSFFSTAAQQNVPKTKSTSVSTQLAENSSLAITGDVSLNETQPVSIPGFSNDQEAISIKFGVNPVSQPLTNAIQNNLAKKLAKNKQISSKG